MKFLLRLVLLIAGLVFALSLMVMMTVLLALWGLRALWGKLTGKPAQPFVMRMSPRSGFEQVFQRTRRVDESDAAKPYASDDVMDVEPKNR